MSSLHAALTGLGLVTVLGVTAARAWTTVSTKGPRRRIERTYLICHLGTVLALLLYAMTTSWGPSSLQTDHIQGALDVLYPVLLVASLVPVLMIEIALGVSQRMGFDIGPEERPESSVDIFRTRDVAWSGLTLAFALSLLMVTCQVAKERNIQKDVSYFKTSAAGESTQNIVRASPDTIHAYMFFPDTNEVTDSVRNYFESLASSAGKLEVSVHNRMDDIALASKFKVSKDGVVVLARGTGDKEKSQTVEVPEQELKEPEKMRRSTTLRTFDSKVNSALMKLARDKRKAYLMTGHGEMNDPESMPPELKGRVPVRPTTKMKQRLAELNYEIKDLGLIDLVSDIPDDATVVVLLAPTIPLQEAEWAALDRYLTRGGRIMIALDPKGDESLGALSGRLGLKMVPGDLTDDAAYYPTRNAASDRRNAITSQFSAHASTTSLSRTVGKGILLLDAGALEDVPFTGKDQPKKTITLRSQETSWMDLDNNFQFDKDTEKRQRWNIGAAVEGPKLADGKDGFRVLVYSDADLFADLRVQNELGQTAAIIVSGPLLDDSIRWLGGEEVFAGDIVSEEDTAVQHTKNETAVWFFLTVIGVPFVVLGIGLWFTLYVRRRRVILKKPPTAAKVTP
jgi:hypothetical protein